MVERRQEPKTWTENMVAVARRVAPWPSLETIEPGAAIREAIEEARDRGRPRND